MILGQGKGTKKGVIWWNILIYVVNWTILVVVIGILI